MRRDLNPLEELLQEMVGEKVLSFLDLLDCLADSRADTRPGEPAVRYYLETAIELQYAPLFIPCIPDDLGRRGIAEWLFRFWFNPEELENDADPWNLDSAPYSSPLPA